MFVTYIMGPIFIILVFLVNLCKLLMFTSYWQFLEYQDLNKENLNLEVYAYFDYACS